MHHIKDGYVIFTDCAQITVFYAFIDVDGLNVEKLRYC